MRKWFGIVYVCVRVLNGCVVITVCYFLLFSLSLELVVEPLNGKSFTVYPQVTTNDTIEKLKLDVSL